MSFPRYPEYKDSGVEWLGEVPAHWFVGKVKHITSFFTGWTPPTGNAAFYEGENPWANISDLGPKWLVEPSKRISDDAVGHSGIRLSPTGSLLFSFKLSIGQVSFAARDMYTNEAIATFPPSERLNLEFAYYALPLYVVQNASENIYGAKLLNQELIKAASVAVPSIHEQQAIATFLDRETAKIDALVAEQEKLIALLQEKRQAVISHAVTKGLDPNVPMKDSGVEWLGEVPGHWEVGALSYLSTIETGSTPDRNDDRYWNGSIPWLKTGEINWAPIREAEEFITEAGLANSAAKLSPAGTMLMAMYGQGVTRGRVALLEIEAAYNQACAAITFGPRIRPTFGRYFFMAAYDHIREGGNETSQMNLSAGLIAKFRMTIPPIDEQTKIVNRLDAELAKLDVLSGEAELAITLLQERRTALISAAVTGQIDVRGLVGGANAPDFIAASAYPLSARGQFRFKSSSTPECLK